MKKKKQQRVKYLLIGLGGLLLLFGLYKLVVYKLREKSCRDYSGAWLELDEKYPLPGKKDLTGFNNVGKYEKMYEECMFLQGY